MCQSMKRIDLKGTGHGKGGCNPSLLGELDVSLVDAVIANKAQATQAQAYEDNVSTTTTNEDNVLATMTTTEDNVLWDVVRVIPTEEEKVECCNDGCTDQAVATWSSNVDPEDPEDKRDLCEKC